MAFVIEPGLYIRELALDNLPKTAENAFRVGLVVDRLTPSAGMSGTHQPWSA